MTTNHIAGAAKTRARRLSPSCPICNDELLAPTASAHVSERNVRHVWACETCGHGFVTSVRLPPAPQPELCVA